jgi:hypothetical protein
MIDFALALLVMSVVLNVCLLVSYRRQSERARRLERDRRISELERDLRIGLPAVPGQRLAHLAGVMLGLWLRERWPR